MGDLILSEECMGSGMGKGKERKERKNYGWYKNEFLKKEKNTLKTFRGELVKVSEG